MDTVVIIEIIVLVLMILVTVTTNMITLFVIACTDYLRNINKVYFYSITISDLCLGVCIFPFAVYSSSSTLFGLSGVLDTTVCHFQAYLTVILFLSGVYALAWTNVDHYVAVRKPERYKLMMSPPRSLCWIVFAWIAAVSFCFPPLLSFQESGYYHQVYICTIWLGHEIPYFVTAGVLALLPALLVIVITDIYLFTHGFRKKQKMYEAVLLDVSSRPRNYQINFIVSIIYACTWLPWCILRIVSFYTDAIPDIIHFMTFWVAMGNSFYKFFVYTVMSLEYRRGLQELVSRCCASLQCTCCCACCFHGDTQNAATTVTASANRLLLKPTTSRPSPAMV